MKWFKKCCKWFGVIIVAILAWFFATRLKTPTGDNYKQDVEEEITLHPTVEVTKKVDLREEKDAKKDK